MSFNNSDDDLDFKITKVVKLTPKLRTPLSISRTKIKVFLY